MNTVPSELGPLLNKQLVAWLSYTRTAQTGSLFRSPDVAEVDGTPGMGLCTALSLGKQHLQSFHSYLGFVIYQVMKTPQTCQCMAYHCLKDNNLMICRI